MLDNAPPPPRFFARRPPVFLQSTVAECGLACLGTVAASYGNNTPLRELRVKFPVAMTGMSITQLVAVAKAMGLASRPLRAELNELKDLRLPAILHWDLEHFVVLVRCNKKRATIIDPALGRRNFALSELSRHFSGVALEVWPTREFKLAPKPARMGLASLWTSLSGLGPALTKVLLLSLVLQTASLLLPLQTQLLIDQAIGRSDANFLEILVIGFGLIQLFSILGGFLRNYLSLKLTQSLSMGLHSNVVEHLLRLPLSYFQNRHLGDILNKIDSINSIQGFLQAQSIGLLVDGVMAVVTLGLLLAYGPVLTLLIVLSIVLSNIIDVALLRFRKSLAHESLIAASRQNTFLIEMIKGVQPLRLFNKTQDRFSVWQGAYANQLSADARVSMTGYFASIVEEAVNLGFNVAITYFVASEVMANRFTIGMMTAVLAYSAYFSRALNGLISFFVNYRMLEVPLERLSDITQSAPESEDGQKMGRLKGHIAFKDVWFRYHPDLPWVLQGVNFEIKPGEHVAISGASGSGKSTLLKLLLRAYEPEKGEILIDGRPLRGLAVNDYRSQLGTVMQNDELFSGSIAENVCLFAPKPDMPSIETACSLAKLDDEIRAMPMGYATLIGDMGSTLSGGQKQRLLLARALYGNPAMLLVDEATSHLDGDNEKAVNRSVKALAVTRLTIAHRRETLAAADRVLVLNDGTV